MKSLPEETITRMRKSYGVSTDKQLADLLGTAKQSVWSWKKAGVPLQYALKCKEECGVSLDFLYYGHSLDDQADTEGLVERTKNLTSTQKEAISNMIDALEKLITEFELDNEKVSLVDEMSERLRKLERK